MQSGTRSPPLYDEDELPLFGTQYRFSEVTNAMEASVRTEMTVMRADVSSSDPYEEMCRLADAQIQQSYLESLNHTAAGTPSTSTAITPWEITGQFSEDSGASQIVPGSCIICVEDFDGLIEPPEWISLECLHPPSLCRECMSKCIKNDLENKLWDQIQCPECNVLLPYEDIRRLADRETFVR